MKLINSLLIAALLLSQTLFAQSTTGSGNSGRLDPSEKSWKFAEKQLKKMTIEEKVGQLIHIGINARYANQDSPFFKEIQRQVVANKVGGILVFAGGLYETVHFVNRMQENAKTPLLISADFETGVGMRFDETTNFPWNMAVAATGNPEFARRKGVMIGRESKAIGVHYVFGPVVDVNNNADNPVINFRSYGENPADVARFGVALMQGIQSQKVIATAKHFPGHGDTNVDSHRGLPIIDVSRKRLNEVELVPFKAVVDAGIASVMIAHIGLPQIDAEEVKPLKESINIETDSAFANEKAWIPATLSKTVITDILKNEMKFKGLAVSDAMAMSGLTQYFNQDEAAVRAILAGMDILEKPIESDTPIRGLLEAVKSGRIPMSRIDDAVKKQLAYKHELGLFKQKTTKIEDIDKVVSNSEMRQLGEEIARNAVTLVKAETNILPLKRGTKAALLCITNGEDRLIVGNPLANNLRANGIQVDRIVLDERSSPAEITAAIARLKRADVVIAGLYARVRSGAKNSIGIPTAGEQALREALSGEKPVISVSFGNPYFLRSLPEIKTYIVAYGDMPSLQTATGDAIVGKNDFVGKLPITIGSYPIGTGLSLKK